MYSVVRAVMLRPVTAGDPDRLVHVYESNPSRGLAGTATSIGNYAAWKERSRTLDLAAFIRVSRNSSNNGEAQRFSAIAATASFLPVSAAPCSAAAGFRARKRFPANIA
jgi:hypothetical protein